MEKDEELGLVTLEEMYNCFKSDEYKEFREDFDVSFVVDENGKESVSYIYAWDLPENSPFLYRHIVAEQLFRTDYRLVNWEYMSAFSEATFYELMDLMLNPLVWQDKRLYYDSLIEGRIAKEEFDRSRLHRVWEIMYYIREEGILNFADNPYVFDEDLIGANYIKGMHDWGVITTDYGEIMMNIYQGARFTYSDLSKNKHYDIKQLRTSILKISEKRGGKRAEEILSMLQEEWPKIKRWKTHFENMTEDDICQFEDILMNGFETELEEWESKGKKAEQTSARGPKETTVFRDEETAQCETERFLSFINKHKMREDDVDAAWDNRVNQVAVCFYRIWKEKNMLMAKAGGTSLSRFIINCGLSISVKEKAHGNALNRMIQSDDMFSMYVGDVRASFYN